jgi:hypothetical protein
MLTPARPCFPQCYSLHGLHMPKPEDCSKSRKLLKVNFLSQLPLTLPCKTYANYANNGFATLQFQKPVKQNSMRHQPCTKGQPSISGMCRLSTVHKKTNSREQGAQESKGSKLSSDTCTHSSTCRPQQLVKYRTQRECHTQKIQQGVCMLHQAGVNFGAGRLVRASQVTILDPMRAQVHDRLRRSDTGTHGQRWLKT